MDPVTIGAITGQATKFITDIISIFTFGQRERETTRATVIYDLPEKDNQSLIIFVLFLLLIFAAVFFYFLNKGKNG